LNIRQAGSSLAILSWSCLAVFPITFLFLLLMRSFGLAIPLRPLPPQGQHWLSWLVYQFAWVAVAEEVFFRGYLQSNIVTLARPAHDQHSGPHAWIGVVISAGCFAAAHVIIQGQMLSILTFLPGLVLGWLFLRTRSLLPPILFHGLANAFYYWAAAALA
jgi:membrane protease YdiL (CAAX protease family)